METLLIYLLNASAGTALFYSVYWLFLRKETFHLANRWFLVGTLLASVLLPLFPIRYAVMLDSGSSETAFRTIADTFKNIPVASSGGLTNNDIRWEQAVLLIYLTGVTIFMFRLLVQSIILIRLMIKHRVKAIDNVKIVENEKYGLPFSFFNIVFINPKFHTQEDLPEILD